MILQIAKHDFQPLICCNLIDIDIPIGDVTKDVDISTDTALDDDIEGILVDLMML